jgi:hypothetical protein
MLRKINGADAVAPEVIESPSFMVGAPTATMLGAYPEFWKSGFTMLERSRFAESMPEELEARLEAELRVAS